MHVAMLIGALYKGGAEHVLVNLADYMISQGHKVTVVTQYIKENEYELNRSARRVLCDITEKETTKSRCVNFKRRFCKLRNIWKQEKPDVILSFIGKNNIMAIMTSVGLGIPVAVSVRSEPAREYYNPLLKFLAKHLFGYAAGVVLQTKASMDFFPQNVRKKAVILKNPVSAEFFRDRYVGIREKVIVSVGRVDENKNHRMLIRAFSGIAEEFPEYKVIIYGEGDKRQELQKMVKDMGMGNRIFLPGNINYVADAIYKTRVFVLTSNKEGMPNVLIEAMVMGLTVIATDCPCGGPGELICSGENGILIPVGDEKMLQEKLHFLLNNLQEADSMGEKASVTGEIYSPEKVFEEWGKYLISLELKGNRR